VFGNGVVHLVLCDVKAMAAQACMHAHGPNQGILGTRFVVARLDHWKLQLVRCGGGCLHWLCRFQPLVVQQQQVVTVNTAISAAHAVVITRISS
jgi:hypothetical protein